MKDKEFISGDIEQVLTDENISAICDRAISIKVEGRDFVKGK